MITDEQIAEWERLAGAATAGTWIPWVVRDADDPDGYWLATSSNHVPTSEDAKADAAFIAASREAVPRLIAALREARALLADASTHLRVVAHNIGVEIERGAHQWDGVDSLLSEKAARIDAALGGES